MHAMPIMVGALCVLAIAYRYYSAFIAARALSLDDTCRTPAHTMADGQNYVPTNRWVLFGHHFAAITGAGPLIGPVLAAQFGFLPGLLWLVIGVVIGGAVHDFVILVASVRRGGRSLAEIARLELGPLAGAVTAVAILFIVVIALAGLGVAVVNALKESSWGTFTIAMTIPIALFMSLYMYRLRKGRIAEASAVGVVLLLGAVVVGRYVPTSPFAPFFTFDAHRLTILIGAYGFVASVLPVWMLLCPRDYLSAYMKLGTIALLVIGVVLVNPEIHMPAVSEYAAGGGPIVSGKLFPFVFITIACGAISGFHSLVASGTTPKMIDRESDCRRIGYGAMLLEGLVGVTALIAASSLFPADYFAINVTPERFSALGLETVRIAGLERQIGESVTGRPGGAVSLAIGMAQIFSGLPGMRGLVAYWYHFAIMFEALFILTTIDTGTRVARFLVQESLARFVPRFAETNWVPGTLLSTAMVVFAWGYFLYTGSIQTIWPMFGIANQLLAVCALTIGGAVLYNSGKRRYVWITLVPMSFVSVTTLTAGYLSIRDNFLPMARSSATALRGALNVGVTAILMASTFLVIGTFVARLRRPQGGEAQPTVAGA